MAFVYGWEAAIEASKRAKRAKAGEREGAREREQERERERERERESGRTVTAFLSERCKSTATAGPLPNTEPPSSWLKSACSSGCLVATSPPDQDGFAAAAANRAQLHWCTWRANESIQLSAWSSLLVWTVQALLQPATSTSPAAAASLLPTSIAAQRLIGAPAQLAAG